jgi:peptidyl-prolyl cis-trans isomerase SDCCAG10
VLQYFDDTIFHRIIPKLMVQAGDPTGTGNGGDSIYGKPFKDEFHKNLVFQHRGILACANENKPNTNGSQFFLTLDATSHLNRRNTIFGKVVGTSIFTLAEIGEKPTDGLDRPLDPPRIVSVEVDDCPFDDIMPRALPKRLAPAEPAESATKASVVAAKGKPTRRRTGKKASALLSFGEDDEDGDEDDHRGGMGAAVGFLRQGLRKGGIGSAVGGGSALASDEPDAVPANKRVALGGATTASFSEPAVASSKPVLSFEQRMADRMKALQSSEAATASAPLPPVTGAGTGKLHSGAAADPATGGSSSAESIMAAYAKDGSGGKRTKRGRKDKQRDAVSRLASFTAALRTAGAEKGSGMGWAAASQQPRSADE